MTFIQEMSFFLKRFATSLPGESVLTILSISLNP